ncbi:MAG TPA: tetratricopeptide repeat protein, partial [Nitrososphaeraceae archaeon]|nr:tetratricopeptide repeat protein [Nitrososphaeraceae archaeon]
MTDIDNLLDKIVAISNNDNEIVLKVNNTRDQNFSSDSLIALADLLLGKGYYEYADKIYDLILEVSPSSSHALYNKGLAHLSMGNYEESLSLFDSVINLKQEYVADAYTSRATALDYLNRPEEAERFYALAQEAYSNRIKKLTEEVLSFQKSGDYKESLKPVEQILTIEPNNRYGMYLKALALYNLKEYEESIPAFEKYIELDPNNVKALSYLGNASISLGQYNKAIKLFDQIISIKQKVGTDADSRYYKGNALLFLERLKEAEDEYKKVLSIYEKTEGTEEKRISTLEKLRSIYSNYPNYFNFEEALLVSKKIVELDQNNNIRFKLMLSEDLIKTNNTLGSKKILKEINEFSSNDGRYKKIYEFLILCSNFLDLDESNDNVGLISFHKFFESKEFDPSNIDSNFWNFNSIKYFIEESKISNNRNEKNILLQIIDCLENNEKRRIVKDSITSYFSTITQEQRQQILETKKQTKTYKLIALFLAVGLAAAYFGALVYYNTITFTEYPPIVIPESTVDWTIDLENGNEKLYYITKERQFVTYDIRKDKWDYIRSLHPWMNAFFEMLPVEPPTKTIKISENPIKLIHDNKKDLTFVFVADKSGKKGITFFKEEDGINNNRTIPLIGFGSPTDLKFDDNYLYISTKKPNNLLIFGYKNSSDTIFKNKEVINLLYEPAAIALEKDNNRIFLINSDSATLSLFLRNGVSNITPANLKTIGAEGIKDIKRGESYFIPDLELGESNFIPGDVIFNEPTNQLMIHNKYYQDLIVLDTTDLTKLKDKNLNLKKIPFKDLRNAYIGFREENSSTFVAVPDTRTIHVIEPDKSVQDINKFSKMKISGTSIGKMMVDDENNILFIHLRANNTIKPIYIDKNILPGDQKPIYFDKYIQGGDHYEVGSDPFGMAFDRKNSILYVTNTKNNSISIIDTIKNNVNNINVGAWPNEIAFDDNEHKVFVVNTNLSKSGDVIDGPSSITIINTLTNKSTENLTGGFGSYSMGLDTINNKIYVSNMDNNIDDSVTNGTVSILDYNGRILKNITVNISPLEIAVNPYNGLVYVAHYDDDSVSIIDSRNDSVIQNLIVGNGPNDIVVQNETNDKSKIFVVNSLSDTVSVLGIDGNSTNKYHHKVINTISVGRNPLAAAYYEDSKNNEFLYVPDKDNKISVIDTKTSNIFPVGTISIQGSTNQAGTVAVNTNKGIIYIASSEYDKISSYDPKMFLPNDVSYPVKSIQTGKNPHEVKIDQYTGDVYVSNLQSQFINVFSKQKSFPTEIKVSDVSHFDIDQITGDIYIAYKHSDNISIYNYNFYTHEFQNTKNITLGYQPLSIFIDEFYSRLLVSGNNMLKVYDLYTLKPIANISVGLSANSINVDEMFNRIYLNDPLENEVLELDGYTYEKILKDFPDLWTGVFPSSIAINQKTGNIYIANKDSDTITTFDTVMISKEIAGAYKSPTDLAINFLTDRLYVVNEKSGTVSIIDTVSNKILKNIKVGNYPNSIDIDIVTGDIYVTSSYTNTMYKILDDTLHTTNSIFNEDSKILVYVNSKKVQIANTEQVLKDWEKYSIIPSEAKDIESDSKYVYVSNSSPDKNFISRIDLENSNLTNLDLKSYYPSSITISPNNKKLYILDENKRKILIIDTNKFKMSEDSLISLEDSSKNITSPISIAVDPELDILYVADEETNSIFKLNATGEFIGEIPLKDKPVS